MVNTVDEICKAIVRAKESMLNFRQTCNPSIFYTAGTGIPDELAVEYYKDTNQYVITRDGTIWYRGQKIKEKKLMEIRNAQITNTMLGREDHGIFTFMIYIQFGACGCGIGGYSLDEYNKETKTRVFQAESMEIIAKILDVVGVDTWEQLKGQYIRIKDNGWGSTVDEIGNLMEEKWINIREFFKEKQNGR